MMLSLNGKWKLTCAWPWAPELGRSFESGSPIRGLFPDIEATVPGGVYADLLAAGLIEDPMVASNSLKSEWVESKWWVYERAFPFPMLPAGRRAHLRFEGLDYAARVYLNGRFLARHEGTCVPLELDATDALREGENLLRVVFEEAPREVALGRTRDVQTVKPRFCYKWDFGTRLVNVGIWDDVSIRVTGTARLLGTHIATDYDGESGFIRVSVQSDAPARLAVRVTAPDGREWTAEDGEGREISFRIESPQPWYPNGYGDHPLYRVRLSLYDEAGLSDEAEYEVGIRSLSFLTNEGAPEGAPPYTVAINGRRVYIKGVNLTPLDHQYGCVSDEKYERLLTMAAEAHVNLVRVWGGGLIEKEIFYSLCDRLGLLVWQEFTQSGSGVESVPREDEAYLALLKVAAVSAVSRRRNHVSLAIWCGGNELRARPGEDTPVATDNKNIRLLAEIVGRLDPQRMFYPSSANGPFEFVHEGAGWDAHGFWRHQGVREHYRLYNECDNLLHSEYGVDGMSSARGVALALGQSDPGVRDMSDPLWRFHGEWWDNLEVNRALFGEFPDLPAFATASQLMQAEGVRYIAEADMRRAFRNSGTIVWQFNEPWRNVSCTNLVEYDLTPKLAYRWLKNAFAPVAASLKYDALALNEGETAQYGVYLSAFGHPGRYRVAWRAEVEDGRALLQGESELDAPDGCTLVSSFELIAPAGLLFVTLSVYQGKNKVHDNLYFFSAGVQPPLGRLPQAMEGRNF